MKPTITYQKFIAGRTYRVAKYATCTRIQFVSNAYWINVDLGPNRAFSQLCGTKPFADLMAAFEEASK